MKKFTNRLIKETSPYLLQHAHNPVDWYPWGEEALQKAKSEDKPILVSIGYAACHWCHVMERESFEDEATAALMNEYFVNIKIDREERPDLDHIYMDAVQAMSGSGGWPLNVFLTPTAKPFYGGTYFPPIPAHNRPSWKEVLKNIHQAFKDRRHEIDAQAENLTDHLVKSNGFGFQKMAADQSPFLTKDEIELLVANLMKNADKKDGGFGAAPKFPQTSSIRVLMHHHFRTGNFESLQQALLSLNKMIEGGIYDQIGGGFARYSTDKEWLAPHFEKMLYDNALLISVISEAYQLTGKESYKRCIEQTIQFLRREMLSEEGGFYAALDADSEGVEGKFYVWDLEEVKKLLGDSTELFASYYDITDKGNWEHKNILRVKKPIAHFAQEHNLSDSECLFQLDRCGRILLEARSGRIRPALDDKILLGWNALMISALCKAYSALAKDEYLELARDSFDFVWNNMRVDDVLYHTYKKGEARYPAFLDDLAYLIQASLHLQEVSADQSYLIKAKQLTDYVIDHFSEEETGFFFFTDANQQDVIVRKKEVYDGATPSGNAVMAKNLQSLGIIFDKQEWVKRSEQLLGSLRQAIIKYPGSFGVWADLAMAQSAGIPEIALVGENFKPLQMGFLRIFIPFYVFQSATLPDNQFPLLAGKTYSSDPQFYLCRNYTCQSPVNELSVLERMIRTV
jgi:uncharacterized protein